MLKYIFLVPVDIYCHLIISVYFIFIFTSFRALTLTKVPCISIFQRRDPYSFNGIVILDYHYETRLSSWIWCKLMASVSTNNARKSKSKITLFKVGQSKTI